MDWNSLRWETAVWKPFLLHFVWESSFNLVLCLGLRCNYRSFVSPSARWAVSCSSLIVGFTSWNRHSLKKKKRGKHSCVSLVRLWCVCVSVLHVCSETWCNSDLRPCGSMLDSPSAASAAGSAYPSRLACSSWQPSLSLECLFLKVMGGWECVLARSGQ